jgi:hypothetical protein
VVLGVALPNVLSDAGNTFLRGFVNQELLATLGVIVTITLASAGNMHIELGKIAQRLSIDLDREKQAVRASAYLLLVLLVASLALVTLKPVIATSERASAFANGIGLFILAWAIAVLYDLTRAAFRIGR